MKPAELLTLIEEEFGDAILESSDEGFDPYVVVEADSLRKLAFFLRDDERMHFDFLRTLSGVDKVDFIESVLVLYSYIHRHQIIVKVETSRKKPEVETVADIWKAANWYEREAYDLFGIHYKGHPDLRRLMMPHDWVGHPLLKDYKQPKVYHGIDLYRFNPVLKVEDKKAKKKKREKKK